MCWVWQIHPYNIKLNHNGNANVRVSVKWLVLVKIYGNNPKTLLGPNGHNGSTLIFISDYLESIRY